ncbi:hypothetical protein [Streptomyces sp. NPDC059063]|uniref:hypothetical protein n=1 Tax=unclassified Streptomyces TaxID=2593676 RepID=UPI0036A07600
MWLWLLLLLPFLFLLCSFCALVLVVGSGGETVLGLTLLISGLALLADIVWLIIYGFRANAQAAGAIAVTAILAATFAWAYKTIRAGLLQRAQVLITEHLSAQPLERSAIRERVYGDGMLFRLHKAIYVDALAALLSSGTVKIVNGKYSMAEATSTGEPDGSRRPD